MKALNNLSPAKGSNQNKKRLGRGIGSGLGKTAGKGHKGQLQRSGGTSRPGFEGGQMPMYRRLPKRGFTNHFRQEYNEVNVSALNKFDAKTKVTVEALKAAGLLRHPDLPVKILAKGKLEKAVTIAGLKTSASAKAAIEKAGGKVEEI